MLYATKCQQITNAIVAAVKPLRVAVFGSAVNGAARANDLDFLVVMPDGSDCRQVAQSLYQSIKRPGIGIDLVVVTQAEFLTQSGAHWSVVSQAKREGVDLYVA